MPSIEARTPKALDDFLGIDPVGKTPREIELEWFENHYRGDVPQLTVRAVLIGSLLGGFMSLSNLYIGLKTGWAVGMAITACIVSFSLGTVLKNVGLLRSNLSILENNCMQSTASSAGYSTGGAMVSAVAAFVMIRGEHMPFWTLLPWTVFLAVLGVVMAIPMKRQMIDVEQLKFPSGVAAAETLRSLYAAGKEVSGKARGLGIAGAAGVVLAFLRDNTLSWWPRALKVPEMLEFPGALAGRRLIEWTISWEMSLIMVAAGAIMGLRVTSSMLIGGVVNYAWLAPRLYEAGIIRDTGFRGIVSWSIWGGTAAMVTSGLFIFALQWRTIARAFSGLSGTVEKAGDGIGKGGHEALAAVQVPTSWMVLGFGLASIGVIAIQVRCFSIRWWMGCISVLMTFLLSIVACRATGETDVTPIGAMGKMSQLAFGVAAPNNITTNLMTACVTAGAAASAADLLTDLKSGYLLGANPRKQFIAQFLGIFSGAAFIVPAFYLLVPSPDILGSDKFPAPSAQVWKGVAELLSRGIGSLDASARWALFFGGLTGIALPVAERLLPTRLRRFVPSPMGLGLAFVIPFWNTLAMFAGSLLAESVRIVAKRVGDMYIIPVASGIIAGESLMGVLMTLLAAFEMMR
mgnify:CR=1 FL=1